MEQKCISMQEHITQLAEGMAENRSEHRSFRRRLDELEDNIRRQSDILITLQRQADAIESINHKIDCVAESLRSVSGRVSEMEKEPAEKWKKVGFEIIKYIVLAVLGGLAGYFAK